MQKIKEKRRKQRHIKDAETLTVRIEELNEKGDGVAVHSGIKLTVKKTLPNELVEVRYVPSRPPKDRIQLLNILQPSPLRSEPPCPYFYDCGGCQLQHISYEKQLDFKRDWMQRLLENYPELKHISVEPVSGMPEAAHYRNKTQMPFQAGENGVVYGLYRKGTHEITPIDHCLVENTDANLVLQIVKKWASDYRVPAYDEKTHTGLLRHVMIRKGQFTNQVMAVIVSRTKELPHWQELARLLRQGVPTLKNIILNINPAKTNVILGEENIPIWGDPYIEEKLGRIRFKIYPGTFFQTNSVQMVRILEKMNSLVRFSKTDRVLDLFCGVGTIGLYLARKVEKVMGVDNNEESIEAATQNANDNDIANARFFAADVRQNIPDIMPADFRPTVAIVDPPRRGLSAAIINDLLRINPEKLVYISCNPKTLANDLATLQNFGFRGDRIYPFDMFPHTSHVESLVILHRENS